VDQGLDAGKKYLSFFCDSDHIFISGAKLGGFQNEVQHFVRIGMMDCFMVDGR
jgi:hypothetical protein